MGATSPHPRQHRPRRRVPSRLQATGISKFMPSDDGDDNKGGRSQRGKGAEAAEQDMREMADEVTGLWNMPVIPWKEFFEKLSPPPSTEKWAQRLRLNQGYYKANYMLITAGITLALAITVDVYIWLGFLLGILSAMCKSYYWVNALSPYVRKISGKSVYLMMDPEDGSPTLMVTRPNSTKERDSMGGLVSMAEEQLVTTLEARTVALFLSMWSSYLLISMPVRSILVFGVAAAVGGALSFLHATLRQPGLKSSVAGLLNINSRKELDNNLRTLWDLARGKGDNN